MERYTIKTDIISYYQFYGGGPRGVTAKVRDFDLKVT